MIIGFALTACNRQLPDPETSTAIFYVKGILDGKNINFSAGDHKYYMLPNYEDDTLGIRSYTGKLGNLNCVGTDDCPESIEFLFRENESNGSIRYEIDKSIFNSVFAIRGPADYLFTSYKATFISKSLPAGANHFWDFGDGVLSTDVNPTHYYLDKVDSVIYPHLRVESGSGCSSVITYESSFNSGCDVDFTPGFSNGHLTLSSVPVNSRSELWDFSNGYLPLGPGNIPPTDSVFLACVESTDTLSGCVSYKCKNIILDTSRVACVANFDIYKEVITSVDVRDYLEVTIKWRNSEGKLFSSDRFEQPLSNSVEILEVERYSKDINGHPTKKVTLKFNIRLFGDNETDFVDLSSEKSVIALAYQ
tara:strand:- start:114903 stop:115991 length:1089 start_codon:yes stop_codon:yes gene_type:complete